MNSAIDYTNLWRYPGGYSWVSGKLILEPANSKLIEDSVLTTGVAWGICDHEVYKPPPDLFLVLANTSLTQEAIKHFADQYGLLGLGKNNGNVALTFPVSPASPPQAGVSLKDGIADQGLGEGELLSRWRDEITAIRDTTNLWKALRQALAGDSGSLSQHVKWVGNDLVYYDSHPQAPLPPWSQMMGNPA
jgi:hypothetical protein